MKQTAYEKRRPYLDQVEAEYAAHTLSEQSRFLPICGFCKFFYMSGPDYETNEVDVECEHPLGRYRMVNGKEVTPSLNTETPMEGGADCWGFRPKAGAKCDRVRDTSPDLQRPTYAHTQVPGSRLTELIEMDAEKRAELMEAHWEQWYAEHPEYAPRRSGNADDE